jgi:HlyD family secretion protein
MKKILSIKKYVLAYKKTSIVIAIIIIFAGYMGVKAYTDSSTQTLYTIGTVSKGTIVTTISGTGQVSASSQIDLKSQTSGTIVAVPVKNGDTIKAQTLIAQIDSRAASLSLQSARIAYQKLVKPADTLSMLQAEENVRKAGETLSNDYVEALDAIASAFTDLPGVIDGMKTALYGRTGYLSDQNLSSVNETIRKYRNDAGINFDIALNKYNSTLIDYKAITASTPTSTVEQLIKKTADAAKTLSLSLKDAKIVVDTIQSDSTYNLTNTASFQTSVSTWISETNTHLAALIGASTAISNDTSSLIQAQTSLIDLKTGPDELELASARIALEQQQNNYDDNFIRAPFDGVIAKLDVKQNDTISSGAAIATIITANKTAVISLNEVDVAKIAIGNKSTLTFDAIEGLTINGQVSEIDGVGTVSQGVVTYGVTITFDTQDNRVKAGMSVNASIITETKEDVLVVPNSAIKSSARGSYVQVFTTPIPQAEIKAARNAGITSTQTPVSKNIEIGTSNDTNTEIISGLKEGDQVIIKTTTGSTKTTSTTPNILSAVGGRATGANAGRAVGR